MKRTDLMVKYFNKVAGAKALEAEDIPLDVYLFLNTYSNFELAKPFILQDLEKGKSIRKIARMYKISARRVQIYRQKCNIMVTT